MIIKRIGLTTYDLLPMTEIVKSKRYIITFAEIVKEPKI